MLSTAALAPISLSYRLALIIELLPGGDRALRPGPLGPDADFGLQGLGAAAPPRHPVRGAGRQGARRPAFFAPVARLRAPPLPQQYRLPGRPQPYRLPRGFGWLLRVVPETVAYGGQVEHLLADPKMTALLAASPQAGRILRPLCHMLAIKPPPALAAPPRAKRVVSPAAAIPAPDPSRAVSAGCFPGRVAAGFAAAHCRGAGFALGQADPHADPPLGLPAAA